MAQSYSATNAASYDRQVGFFVIPSGNNMAMDTPTLVSMNWMMGKFTGKPYI